MPQPLTEEQSKVEKAADQSSFLVERSLINQADGRLNQSFQLAESADKEKLNQKIEELTQENHQLKESVKELQEQLDEVGRNWRDDDKEREMGEREMDDIVQSMHEQMEEYEEIIMELNEEKKSLVNHIHKLENALSSKKRGFNEFNMQNDEDAQIVERRATRIFNNNVNSVSKSAIPSHHFQSFDQEEESQIDQVQQSLEVSFSKQRPSDQKRKKVEQSLNDTSAFGQIKAQSNGDQENQDPNVGGFGNLKGSPSLGPFTGLPTKKEEGLLKIDRKGLATDPTRKSSCVFMGKEDLKKIAESKASKKGPRGESKKRGAK